MRPKTRFIQSVLKTAEAQAKTPLPWTRGSARAEMIAKRNAPVQMPTPRRLGAA